MIESSVTPLPNLHIQSKDTESQSTRVKVNDCGLHSFRSAPSLGTKDCSQECDMNDGVSHGTNDSTPSAFSFINSDDDLEDDETRRSSMTEDNNVSDTYNSSQEAIVLQQELAHERDTVRLTAQMGKVLLSQLQAAQDELFAEKQRLRAAQSENRHLQSVCIDLQASARSNQANTDDASSFATLSSDKHTCHRCKSRDNVIQDLEVSNQQLHETCSNLEHEVAQAKANVYTLSEWKNYSERLLASYRDSNTMLTMEIAQLQTQLRAAEGNAAKSEEEKQELLRRLEELDAQVQASQNRVLEVETVLHQNRTERKNLKLEVQMFKHRLHEMQVEKQALRSSLRQKEAQVVQEADHTKCREEIVHLTKQVKDVEFLFESSTKQVRTLKAENQKLRTHGTRTQQKDDSAQTTLGGVTTEDVKQDTLTACEQLTTCADVLAEDDRQNKEKNMETEESFRLVEKNAKEKPQRMSNHLHVGVGVSLVLCASIGKYIATYYREKYK